MNIDPSRQLQIFDMGGVLVDVDARQTFLAFEALGMPHYEGPLSNSHAHGGVFADYCDGRISTPDFIAGVRKVCQLPSATDQQIADAWNAMVGQFRPDAIEQVIDLKMRGFKTALLSNCNALHTDLCRQRFPGPGRLDDLFDAVFFSQEIGVSKPVPLAWQKVLDHFGLPASSAVFYDDSQINVDAAEALGIRGVKVD